MYPLSEKPKITIVVPALNEEKLIRKTLKNAREVAPEAEIIVVDSGSTDKTAQIAAEYAKVRRRVGNVAQARNFGAKMATGEIIIFLDADTLITRQFVDEVVRAFRDPEVVGAGGMIMPHFKGVLVEMIFYLFNFMVMVSFVTLGPFLAGTCVAYKRDPFFEVGGFNERLVASEDFDLCRRISKRGRVVFLRKVAVRTSRRRLERLGLMGLILDWAKVTLQYLGGRNPMKYSSFR
ncbi:MAG: glycosyltransferase [Candidatus Hadarchaeum sp.]|uniref:glycosyltransferase n=1 Tax=Candidatus Hadarchaeum sp. TaxID=2883567 RepID=UPI003D0ED8C7